MKTTTTSMMLTADGGKYSAARFTGYHHELTVEYIVLRALTGDGCDTLTTVVDVVLSSVAITAAKIQSYRALPTCSIIAALHNSVHSANSIVLQSVIRAWWNRSISFVHSISFRTNTWPGPILQSMPNANAVNFCQVSGRQSWMISAPTQEQRLNAFCNRNTQAGTFGP